MAGFYIDWELFFFGFFYISFFFEKKTNYSNYFNIDFAIQYYHTFLPCKIKQNVIN